MDKKIILINDNAHYSDPIAKKLISQKQELDDSFSLEKQTFIYQLIYKHNMATQIIKNQFVRSPTLDTVLMVEKNIEKCSGEFNRTMLWKSLPKKVMWQTYLVILEYLESINKIAFDKEGKIAYIWNPKLAKKLRLRKEIKV